MQASAGESSLSTPPEFGVRCANIQRKTPIPDGCLSLVNLTGADSETFYRDLEELADKLAAQEDHNV